MKEYSCYLIFDGLDQAAIERISELAKELGLVVELGSRFLEFEHSGRDASSGVIKFFYELAKIVLHAEGELSCRLIDDERNDHFEFYRIESGRLLAQSGVIIRGPDRVIALD